MDKRTVGVRGDLRRRVFELCELWGSAEREKVLEELVRSIADIGHGLAVPSGQRASS